MNNKNILIGNKYNGIILYKNKLTILKKGFLNFLELGLNGEKTITFNNITALQIKEAGFWSGTFQISLGGNQNPKNGYFATWKDENSVEFCKKDQELFIMTKEYIEDIVGGMHYLKEKDINKKWIEFLERIDNYKKEKFDLKTPISSFLSKKRDPIKLSKIGKIILSIFLFLLFIGIITNEDNKSNKEEQKNIKIEKEETEFEKKHRIFEKHFENCKKRFQALFESNPKNKICDYYYENLSKAYQEGVSLEKIENLDDWGTLDEKDPNIYYYNAVLRAFGDIIGF